MNPTTWSSCSATMPMQLRCRRHRTKSSSSQGNSKLSASMAMTSGMSRRIIQRMWTRTSCLWADIMPASFLVGPSRGKEKRHQFRRMAFPFFLATGAFFGRIAASSGFPAAAFHATAVGQFLTCGHTLSRTVEIRQYELASDSKPCFPITE